MTLGRLMTEKDTTPKTHERKKMISSASLKFEISALPRQSQKNENQAPD